MDITRIAASTSRVDAALEYLGHGIAVIPIRPETKRPAIKWAEFQTRLPTEEEITRWFTQWPEAHLAIVAGEVSGYVVVDCDNEDALAYATSIGMASPIRVKTKRGWHFYFRYPNDGKRRGPRAGVHSTGSDWPQINGLDFRGDGSYAVLPPSNGYTWDVAFGHDFYEDMPVWKDWRPTANDYEEFKTAGFDFTKLDLSSVNAGLADGFVSEWDRTAKYAKDRFVTGKIPTGQGNGRNERVMRYASEQIMQGKFGPELRVAVIAFMREFFVDPLSDREFEATCASVEQMERRNHPERFDESGIYIFKPRLQRIEEEMRVERRLITVADARRLIDGSKSTEYLIEPWLKRGTIVQVFGYSGHGKSMFVANALYAMSVGKKYIGPFEIARFGRVLYLDFENGPGTIGHRLDDMQQMFGDAGERFSVWTPFISEKEMNLNQAAGVGELEALVRWYKPDVVVIDTIRSAWPGLEENKAEQWAPINRLALQLRNAGIGVILMHHSNKPGEDSLGREAGSTNQLTVLETQLRVTQVFASEEDAQNNAGRHDPTAWASVSGNLPPGYSLQMLMELRYGKVREWTDMHDRVQFMGFGSNDVTGERVMVGSTSAKRKARAAALNAMEPHEIASQLHRPVRVIKDWLGIGEP